MQVRNLSICESKPARATFQLWSAFRRIIGDSEIIKTHKVTVRQLQHWSADPRFAESAQSNPKDRCEWILDRLMELGRADIARASVARDARIVGCELASLDPVVPDKSDWREELMDDVPPFVAYQEAVRRFAAHEIGFDDLQAAQDFLVREIKETTARVIADRANSAAQGGLQ